MSDDGFTRHLGFPWVGFLLWRSRAEMQPAARFVWGLKCWRQGSRFQVEQCWPGRQGITTGITTKSSRESPGEAMGWMWMWCLCYVGWWFGWVVCGNTLPLLMDSCCGLSPIATNSHGWRWLAETVLWLKQGWLGWLFELSGFVDRFSWNKLIIMDLSSSQGVRTVYLTCKAYFSIF